MNIRVTGHAATHARTDLDFVVTCTCGWSATCGTRKAARSEYASHLQGIWLADRVQLSHTRKAHT